MIFGNALTLKEMFKNWNTLHNNQEEPNIGLLFKSNNWYLFLGDFFAQNQTNVMAKSHPFALKYHEVILNMGL